MERNKLEDMKGRAAFLTLGCKVNAYETNAMEAAFQNAGYQIVRFTEEADIYVINTCSVTNMADRKSRQMIHRAKKKNPRAVVIAAGCYVETAEAQKEADTAADLLVGNQEKGRIVELFEAYQEDQESRHEIPLLKDETEALYEPLHIEGTGDKTRVFLKIQDGCNQFCSYCIIPYARGRIRSREREDILEEVHRMAEKGFQEIVLNGIHLSSYGMDFSKEVTLEGNEALLSLIEELGKAEGIERIRLGSLEPRFITEAAVKRLSAIKTLCPHFHLSLQSGCNETLKRMNRHYTTGDYTEKVRILRNYFKNPAITTDIIVGFPGETEEEFEETRKFMEKTGFSAVHVFKYSVRKGTRAEKFPNQVPEEEKNRRSEVLIAREKEKAEEYQRFFLGTTQEVLLEEKIEREGKVYYTGHNTRYLKLAVPAEGIDLENQICGIKAEGFLEEGILEGRLLNR